MGSDTFQLEPWTVCDLGGMGECILMTDTESSHPRVDEKMNFDFAL